MEETGGASKQGGDRSGRGGGGGEDCDYLFVCYHQKISGRVTWYMSCQEKVPYFTVIVTCTFYIMGVHILTYLPSLLTSTSTPTVCPTASVPDTANPMGAHIYTDPRAFTSTPQGLSYSVPDAANRKSTARLLQGVSGFFEARQMAALVSVSETPSCTHHESLCSGGGGRHCTECTLLMKAANEGC